MLLFANEDRFDEANAHVEQAMSHTVNDAYKLGRAMALQAAAWYLQGRIEDAKSEALSALEIHEKLGAEKGAEECRDLLQRIERTTRS